MENEDINKALLEKHAEMLLNKKILDLDKATESLLLFYSNYCNNYAVNITNNISLMKNIDINSETSAEIKQMTTSFLDIYQDNLKKELSIKIEGIKKKIATLTDDEYNKELSHVAVYVVNKISDFYLENIGMLIDEVVKDTDSDTNKRITDYLKSIVHNKLINMIKDQLTYTIRLIDNNYEENYQIMESISKKTLNRA